MRIKFGFQGSLLFMQSSKWNFKFTGLNKILRTIYDHFQQYLHGETPAQL